MKIESSRKVHALRGFSCFLPALLWLLGSSSPLAFTEAPDARSGSSGASCVWLYRPLTYRAKRAPITALINKAIGPSKSNVPKWRVSRLPGSALPNFRAVSTLPSGV